MRRRHEKKVQTEMREIKLKVKAIRVSKVNEEDRRVCRRERINTGKEAEQHE